MYTDDGIVVRLPEADETPAAGSIFFEPEEIEELVVARSARRPVRGPLPRVRGPLAAAPAAAAGPAHAAVAAAAELGRPAPGGAPVRVVPRRARDLPRVPAGRVRPPGAIELIGDRAREVRVVEVDTSMPSPFASSLQFGYVGAFMYEGDAPLAERRAQALSLDRRCSPRSWAGRAARADRSGALAELELELQLLTPSAGRDADDLHDVLRALGDLTEDEASRPRRTRELMDAVERRAGHCACGSRARSVDRDRGRVPIPRRAGRRAAAGVPERSSSRSPTRSATSSPASRARTGRSSPPMRPRARPGRRGRRATLRRLGSAAGCSRATSGRAAGREWIDVEVLRVLRRRRWPRSGRRSSPSARGARAVPACMAGVGPPDGDREPC